MMMPMLGLIIALLVIGGLGSLVAYGDPRNARMAPFIGFVSLFAGVGAIVFCAALTLIGAVILKSESLGTLGFFAGYIFGGLAGAIFGIRQAVKRLVQIESDLR